MTKHIAKSGTLSGTDTLDTVIFTVDLPANISYTVKTNGDGNNKLRVRCGQRLIAIWAQIHDFEIPAGNSASREFHTSIDGTTSTSDGKQDVRIRVSRDILTKEIDWDLDVTVTDAPA